MRGGSIVQGDEFENRGSFDAVLLLILEDIAHPKPDAPWGHADCGREIGLFFTAFDGWDRNTPAQGEGAATEKRWRW